MEMKYYIQNIGIGICFYIALYIIMSCGYNTPTDNDIALTELNMVDSCYADPDSVLYEYALMFNKDCEGYVPYRYLCPAGFVTIAYGHRIRTQDTFTWVTEHQADSILKHDIDKRLSIIQRDYPALEYNKQLALAWFIFAYGEKDLQIVCSDIERVLKYKHYRKNGEIKESELLEIKAKFIFDMYDEHWFK